jgi:hypothetical protein
MLRLLHEHRGNKLEWVAAELGVSPALISRWRDGSRVPTEDD